MLTERETFHQKLEELYQSLPQDPLRAKAWEKYESLQLPTKKNEVFRYVKLRDLYVESPHFPTLENRKNNPTSTLVFNEGVFLPELSNLDSLPKGVEVLSIDRALKSFGSYLKNRITQTLQNENDPFVALNFALYREGIFLYVPPGVQIKDPIHIVALHEKTSFTMPRIIGSIGKGAEVRVHFKVQGKGSANIAQDWNLEDGAKFHLVQESLGEGNTLHAIRGTIKRDASFLVSNQTKGSSLTRMDYQFDLIGEGATADIASLADLEGKNEAHVNVLIRHLAPHTTSNQLIKNIVRDYAHSSFEGKIFVDQKACKTEAYQLNANLLLSDGARAESKPNLEIFNEDVKASHGATFGQLEPELLFYLQTRGLTKEKAKELLIQGFGQEIQERCQNFPL